ncbi:hypothetical protein ABPG74_018876 [Tetrahymena malaccensis]
MRQKSNQELISFVKNISFHYSMNKYRSYIEIILMPIQIIQNCIIYFFIANKQVLEMISAFEEINIIKMNFYIFFSLHAKYYFMIFINTFTIFVFTHQTITIFVVICLIMKTAILKNGYQIFNILQIKSTQGLINKLKALILFKKENFQTLLLLYYLIQEQSEINQVPNYYQYIICSKNDLSGTQETFQIEGYLSSDSNYKNNKSSHLRCKINNSQYIMFVFIILINITISYNAQNYVNMKIIQSIFSKIVNDKSILNSSYKYVVVDQFYSYLRIEHTSQTQMECKYCSEVFQYFQKIYFIHVNRYCKANENY